MWSRRPFQRTLKGYRFFPLPAFFDVKGYYEFQGPGSDIALGVVFSYILADELAIYKKNFSEDR